MCNELIHLPNLHFWGWHDESLASRSFKWTKPNALISVLCHPVHGLLVTAVICADGDAFCQQVVECVFAL